MFAAVVTIAATAGADKCPPLDRYITLNAGYGPRARILTQSADRPAQSTIPKSSQPTSALTPGGRSSGSAPTSEPPPSPPRCPPQTPAESGQPQEETSEDCCVCYEALVAPMVCLGSCPHRLHLPCYAALRARAVADLRCPACRATVTVGAADRIASHHHNDKVMAEALAIARQEVPAAGGGASTRTTRGERGERAICSICYGLIEGTDHVQVPCSCDVHHRCALGFCEDAIPRPRFVGGARHVTCPNPALHEVHQEVDLHPLQQIRAIGRTPDTPDERAIRNRVTAAELRLRSRTHISPERVDLTRSATERNEEDLFG